MPGDITALVLAGGQGSRMGGVDKGLQPFHGVPLAAHALQRLRQQMGDRITQYRINANRHRDAYAELGVPVWTDSIAGYPGPLGGFLTGLEQCDTPYLLTVPCDTPRFPLDLAERLAQALECEGTPLATAAGWDSDGRLRPQPVFCLLHRSVLPALRDFVHSDGRKVGAWVAQQHPAVVAFDQPGDDRHAFENANTWDELQALQR